MLTVGGIVPQTVLALLGSGVLKAGDPDPGFPASWTRKIIKKQWAFKLFQKQWSWRSRFGVYHFSFSRMLQLICFLLQNALGALGPLGACLDLRVAVIHRSDPWIWSMDLSMDLTMDLIHGPDPRIRPMDQIHGSDPWIRFMDLIHGSIHWFDPWI